MYVVFLYICCMLKQEIEDAMKIDFLTDLRFSVYLMRKIHIYNVKQNFFEFWRKKKEKKKLHKAYSIDLYFE